MVNAQQGWSAQQKRFLNSLAADNGIQAPRTPQTSTTTKQGPTVVDEDDDPEEIDISSLSAARTDDRAQDMNEMMQRMAASSRLHGAAGSGNASSSPMTDAQDPYGIIRQMQAMQEANGGGSGNMNNPLAMLQQMQQSADAGGSGSAADFGGDPFAMMQQMMGSMGGNGMPMPGQMPTTAPIATRVDSTARLWRLIHIASMFLLLLLLDASSIPALGSRHVPGTVFRSQGIPLFWYFITVELVLQTTRLFIYGTSPQPSFINQIAQFLPPPYAGYVLLLARYSQILTTLKDDFFVLLFGLGLSAWWNS